MVRLLRLLCVGSLIVGITAAAAGGHRPSPSPANLQFDLSSYVWGVQLVGTPVYKTLTVTNTGGEKAEDLSASLSGTGFQYRGGSYPGDGGTCHKKINPGHDCKVVIRFLSYDLGTFNGTFRLTYFNSVNTQSISVSLSAISVGGANLVANPSPLAFGEVVTGTAKSLTLQLTNNGGWALSGMKFDKVKSGFTKVSDTCGSVLSAGQSCNVEIRFAPTAISTYSFHWEVEYQDGLRRKELSVNFTGNGTGITIPDPDPDPDPEPEPTLSFGPDESFGSAGWARVDGLAGLVFPKAIAMQADGKIVLVATDFNTGYQNMMVVRLTSNGQLDATFGSEGRAWISLYGIDDQANAVAIQSDGKIVIAGYGHNGDNTDLCVVRLSNEGFPDTSFNGGLGWRCVDGFGGNDAANSLALQADGKIVIAGTSSTSISDDFVAVRFNSDGTMDSGFQGVRTADFGLEADSGMAMGLQSDGGILVGGTATLSGHTGLGAVRWGSAGSLDSGFGQGGFVYAQPASMDAMASSLLIRADDSAVLGGWVGEGSSARFALAGMTANGQPDLSFGSNGQVTSSFAEGGGHLTALTAISNTVLMAAGYVTGDDGSNRFALAAYNRDGSAETTHWSTGNFVWNTDDGTQRQVAAIAYDAANERVILLGTLMDDSSIKMAVSAYRYQVAP